MGGVGGGGGSGILRCHAGLYGSSISTVLFLTPPCCSRFDPQSSMRYKYATKDRCSTRIQRNVHHTQRKKGTVRATKERYTFRNERMVQYAQPKKGTIVPTLYSGIAKPPCLSGKRRRGVSSDALFLLLLRYPSSISEIVSGMCDVHHLVLEACWRRGGAGEGGCLWFS